MNKIMTFLEEVLGRLLNIKQKQDILIDDFIPAPAPTPEEIKQVTVDPVLPVQQPVYYWNTPEAARHSVRVICDEEGLTVDMKNILCACVQVESGFNPLAVHYNKDQTGAVWSTDYGISQINDYWNIGPGKPFPSSDYVLQNPEACVRWMCHQFLAGNAHLWSSYQSKEYLKYL
jgi:hypothetical protein